MESYIGHGGQFLFPFLFGKDLQVIFSTEFFITKNLLIFDCYICKLYVLIRTSIDVNSDVKSFMTVFCPIINFSLLSHQ